MPLPMLKGEEMISTVKDFDLSYDLHYLIETSGGVDGVRLPLKLQVKRNHIVSAPSDFIQISDSIIAFNLDIFVDRKPKVGFEYPAICNCDTPTDGSLACGESCLNR